MSTAVVTDTVLGPRPGPRGRRPLIQLLVPLVLAAAAAGILGARLAFHHTTKDLAPSLRFVPPPPSADIESAWGIRFTAVVLEADRGVIDVRYQIVDPSKSGRIHGGGGQANPADPLAALKNLPVLIRESGGKKIVPSSAMMHFEHFHFQTELVGNTYSILYGNSGGLLHVGDKITIRMADGLKLVHVVVAS
jgi:hypothetical protein